MGKREALSAVTSIHKQAATQVDSAGITSPPASELLKYMRVSGGEVTALDRESEFNIASVSTGDIPHGDYEATFGIDGSTTGKPVRTVGGLQLGTAVASTGVKGTNSTFPMSVHTVLQHSRCEIDTSQIQSQTKSNNVTTTVYQFSGGPDEIVDSWMIDVARLGAESEQLKYTAHNATGPVFVDGPLIPNDLLFWMINEDNPRRRTPFDVGQHQVEEIIRSYLSSYQTLYDKSIPVVGIVKNPKTTVCVDALEKKVENEHPVGHSVESEEVLPEDDSKTTDESPTPDVYWRNDSLLFTDALYSTGASQKDTISKTPWMHRHDFDGGDSSNSGLALEGYRNFNRVNPGAWTEKDYSRVFCYVRPPVSGLRPFRVETLYKFAQDKEMRRKILSETLSQMVVSNTGIPAAIDRADEKVRLSRDIRDRIRASTDGARSSYNDQRGYL